MLMELQYTFFAVFCLLSLVWTFWFVPETSGRTLEVGAFLIRNFYPPFAIQIIQVMRHKDSNVIPWLF